jgi:pimeloyl-ACP methyl ester carboxylesterase
MNSPPAFPSGNDVTLGDWRSHGHSGMTLRDYFAAKAMQALIDNDGLFSEIPTQAYEIADAMLKAREA